MIQTIDFIAKTLLVVTFFVNLYLTILVFTKKPRKGVNRAFGLVLLSVAFWNFTNLILHTNARYYLNAPIVLIWAKLALTAAILIPAFFINFVLIFPKNKTFVRGWKNLSIFIPTLILLAFSPTSYNIGGGKAEDWGYNWEPGILYAWFSAYFIIYVCWGIIILWRKSKKIKNKIIKHQIKYIVFGATISSVLGIIVSGILPLFYTNRLSLYGAPFCIIFTASISYAILRHRFLNIKVAIKKNFLKSFSFILILAAYTYLAIILKNKLSAVLELNSNLTIFIFVLFIALGFPLLKNLLDKLFKNFFLAKKKTKEQEGETVEEISPSFYVEKELKGLFPKVANAINKNVASKKVQVLLYASRYQEFQEHHPGKKLKIKNDNDFFTYLKYYPEILIKEELSYFLKQGERKELHGLIKKVISFMDKQNIDLIFPIYAMPEKQIIALIFLTSKKSRSLYSVQEIKYLKETAMPLSTMLGNAMLYKEAMERIGKEFVVAN